MIPLERRDLLSLGPTRLRIRIGGHVVRAVLDSFTPQTTLFGGAVERLGLKPTVHPDAADRGMRWIAGIGPDRVAATDGRFLPIRIGDYEVDDLPVILADDDAPGGQGDMLIGFDFMLLFHTRVSFSTDTMVIHPYGPVEQVTAVPAAR